MLYTDYSVSILHSPQVFPITNQHMANFISYLFTRDYNYSTIITYISAISYFCKMLNVHDPTTAFFVKKLLVAIKRTNAKPDSRLPITTIILQRLISTIPLFTLSTFHRELLPAMYSLAFHAFLRVGEFTSKSKMLSTLPIQLHDVMFFRSTKGEDLLQVTLSRFKGNVGESPFFIIIPRSRDVTICAYTLLSRYMTVRPRVSGPLFVHESGAPVLRDFFTSSLKQNLLVAGIPASSYKSHSFRIGAASHCASLGLEDSLIMRLGRWKSSAVRKYIRMPSFTAPQV